MGGSIPNVEHIDIVLERLATSSVEPTLMMRKWTLAFPPEAVPGFCGREQASVVCGRALHYLAESLVGYGDTVSATDREPLVFAIMGCTGIGKSRFCDEVGELMFPNQNACVLKVTYNVAGISTLDSRNPEEGFLWRIIAAASQKLPGASLVPTFLDIVLEKRWSITRKVVWDYLEQKLPADKPWILVLDELVKGPKEKKDILSACSWFVRHSQTSQPPNPLDSEHSDKLELSIALSGLQLSAIVSSWRCALITSLDFATVEPMSKSGRLPLFLPQYLLDGVGSRDFAIQLLGTPNLNKQHEACIRLAGGHPRSLVVALQAYQAEKRVPTAIAVVKTAKLPALSFDDLGPIIKASYSPLDLETIQNDERLAPLWNKGALMFSPLAWGDGENESGWISLPLPLIAKAITNSKATGQPYDSFKMMLQHSEASPEKQLEVVSLHSDLSRAALGMGVVPPEMTVLVPNDYPERDWTTLQFDFKSTSAIVTDPVIQAARQADNKYKWVLKTDPRECKGAWYPKITTHPGFESMYPARFPDGTRVLVLRQEKINADAPTAIKGLNMAAELLKDEGQWPGLFLFIVTAMEANNPSSLASAEHPMLFVTAQNAPQYYSPSFSTLAQIELLVHQQSKGSQQEGQFGQQTVFRGSPFKLPPKKGKEEENKH
jgi:hypothetical protein